MWYSNLGHVFIFFLGVNEGNFNFWDQEINLKGGRIALDFFIIIVIAKLWVWGLWKSVFERRNKKMWYTTVHSLWHSIYLLQVQRCSTYVYLHWIIFAILRQEQPCTTPDEVLKGIFISDNSEKAPPALSIKILRDEVKSRLCIVAKRNISYDTIPVKIVDSDSVS